MNVNVCVFYSVNGETQVPVAARKRDSVPPVLGPAFAADSLQFFQQPPEAIQFLKHPSFLLRLLGGQEEIPANGASDHFLHNDLAVKLLIRVAGGWVAVPCFAGLTHSANICILGDLPSPQAVEYAEGKHSPSLLVCFASDMKTLTGPWGQ